MTMWRRSLCLAACFLLALNGGARAAERAAGGGRVNNLKVLSDKVDDVSTVENILKSFVKPGMSDQERSKALWTAVVRYRHQTAPPNEFLAADWEAHDPVKIFNVYGYCMCCCCSAIVEALNRADGREARGRILNGHSVPEVRYSGGWHMFDGSLITWFPRTDGSAAGVDDIAKAVADWYAGHPGYQKNGAKLLDLMRSDGWTGWKARGPALLAACPYYKLGYLPARTHGWDATMAEYDRNCEVYEYGYQVGHRALFSLRPGESLVREAGNRGLHVNREQDPNWDGLKARVPENDLVYVKEFLPGYRGGVAANGVHRYAPDLKSRSLELGAEVFDNVATGPGSQGLRTKAAGQPGVVVIPMSSPYVSLGGTIRLKLAKTNPGARGSATVSLSTNNGRSYETLWRSDLNGSGKVEAAAISLEKTLRRYAYRVKIELESTRPGAVGLEELIIENGIQHAPRTLPWLDRGRNTITVANDADTRLATRSLAFRITPEPGFAKNETSASVGVVFDNLKVDDGACWWTGGTGRMTVPIEVPGDLVSLRLSAQIRARSDKDLIKLLASTDGGKSWRALGQIAGPTAGTTRHFQFDRWPSKTRNVLLRYEMTGNNTVGVLSTRIDADHRDPLSSPSLRPFRVVHRWRESGRVKSHVATVDRLPFRDTIEAGAEPEMISVSYEMPQAR
jgi:hypothetical protein